MSESVWEQVRRSHLDTIAAEECGIAALDALGQIDGVGTLYLSSYGHRILISPASAIDARTLALRVLTRLKDRGTPPAHARKALDAATGRITYSMPGPLPDWTIEVSGGEPRCQIRQVSEEVNVPAVPEVPAHMEVRTRYEIVNPEECGAE